MKKKKAPNVKEPTVFEVGEDEILDPELEEERKKKGLRRDNSSKKDGRPTKAVQSNKSVF